jgi:fatty acid CoA ligase FadD9
MTVEAAPIPYFVERVRQLTDTDPDLRRLAPDETVIQAMLAPGITLEKAVHIALEGYSERPALGERAYDAVVDPATGRRERQLRPRYDTITYFDLHSRVKGLANAWRYNPNHRVDAGDFVAIFGFASSDYAVVDLACLYARAVSVPLQSTLADQDLDEIISDTAAVTVAATVDDLLVAAELAGRHPIRSIIVLDHDERIDDDRDALAAARTELAQNGSAAQLITLDELVAQGEFRAWQPLPDAGNRDEAMVMLLHSSGATGRPKGAIVTERVARFQYLPATTPPLAVVRLMFAPLNHFQGRVQLFNTLGRGGTAYFIARPDMSTLYEDFQLARPTEASMFPRIMDMAYRHFLTEVSRRTTGSERDVDDVRAEVIAGMRETYLGDRIALITMGAAPTPPEVQAFFRECFPVTLIEGYGCTEAGGGITTNGRVVRPKVLDYRLRDVPELGYFATDKPYPRGELAVKTTSMIRGYFKQPEATAKLFDAEGYLLTGDIMEERAPDHLVYVDRRNDVLKLSQGEFVATGNIGTAFENGSPLISQIYVHGDPSRPYLLAVVVPAMELVAQELGPDPEPAALKSLLRRELQRVAAEANLKSFEVPRDFIVDTEPFTFENGLLTSMRKKRRPGLAAHYGPALDELLAELDRTQSEGLSALRQEDSGMISTCPSRTASPSSAATRWPPPSSLPCSATSSRWICRRTRS